MRFIFLWFLRLAVAAAMALALAACSSDRGSPSVAPSPWPMSTPWYVSTATLTPTPSSPLTTPLTTPTPAPDLTGFRYPIEGACLPSSASLLPNAPRSYREGIHEGIDFYDGFACTAIRRGTPVLAAKAGTVSRADWDYVEMTPEERDLLLNRSQQQGYTDTAALDRFRGRQVWLDHGGGVVTRYAHLLGIAEGITVGTFVAAGQVIGFVGNSGSPDGVTDPDVDNHLHFEIRVGDTYLGQGLSPGETKAILEQAFGPLIEDKEQGEDA